MKLEAFLYFCLMYEIKTACRKKSTNLCICSIAEGNLTLLVDVIVPLKGVRGRGAVI